MSFTRSILAAAVLAASFGVAAQTSSTDSARTGQAEMSRGVPGVDVDTRNRDAREPDRRNGVPGVDVDINANNRAGNAGRDTRAIGANADTRSMGADAQGRVARADRN